MAVLVPIGVTFAAIYTVSLLASRDDSASVLAILGAIAFWVAVAVLILV